MKKTRVLVIGLEPNLVDFNTMPEMNAGKVRAELEADQAKLTWRYRRYWQTPQ